MSHSDRVIRQVLDELAHKRVDDHAVWRAVIGHRGWLVPIFELTRHYRVEKCDNVQTYAGEARPQKSLMLYTDTEAALRAQEAGLEPGPVAGDFAGEILFANLAAEWETVTINPGSVPSQSLVIRSTTGDLHRLATAWVGSIRLEHSIKISPSLFDPQLLRTIRGHAEFITLVDTTTNGFVTLRNFLPGIANGILGFTAPDCQRLVLNQLPNETGTRYRSAAISGDRLLTPVDGCDGVVINPLGPGPVWGLPWAMMTDG